MFNNVYKKLWNKITNPCLIFLGSLDIEDVVWMSDCI